MSSNNEIVAVLRQALEALEVANSCIDGYYLPKEKAWLPEVEQAITSLRQAIARAEQHTEAEKHEVSQEPVAMQMDVIVVNLVREGINKHRARELAEHFIKHTHPYVPTERQPKDKNDD